MPALAFSEKVEEKTIDSFIASIREKQPSLFNSQSAQPASNFYLNNSGKGLVCMTPIEAELVMLHSLAARKYELGVESGSYVAWQESYEIWKYEQYPEMLNQKVYVDGFSGDMVRQLPMDEKAEFIGQYRNYLLWLEDMTGNNRDPIPQEILVLAIQKMDFPEIPLERMAGSGVKYLYLRSLSEQTCMMDKSRKAS